MVSSVHEHRDYVHRRKFQSPVSTKAVEKDWADKGFSCSQMTQHAGDLLRKGVEKRDELLVVAQGRLECCVGESNQRDTTKNCEFVTLYPGDELFIPRLTPFKARVPTDISSVLFYIGYE
jgi:hypothetical protein